jgi:hypothetical protein
VFLIASIFTPRVLPLLVPVGLTLLGWFWPRGEPARAATEERAVAAAPPRLRPEAP